MLINADKASNELIISINNTNLYIVQISFLSISVLLSVCKLQFSCWCD